jgi:hypothetical protein
VVVAGFTTCGAALLLPALFFQSPAPVKVAVRTWLPTVRAVALKDAWPVPSTVTPEAHTVVPSVKVTLPTGVSAGGPSRCDSSRRIGAMHADV